MKDMFKAKWMIIFIVFVLVMTYINSCYMTNQNINTKNASTGNTDKMQLNK